MQWYKKSANQGNSVAQNEVGKCYRYSLGVPQDYKEVMVWFQNSVDNDENAIAQFNIGNMYYYGLGVKKDYCLSLDYYTKSAEQGHIGALKNIKKTRLTTHSL